MIQANATCVTYVAIMVKQTFYWRCSAFKLTAGSYELGRGSSLELALQQLQFVLNFFPFLGVCRWVFLHGDDWPVG